MARSARDCALLLDAIAGYDRHDPTSVDDLGPVRAAAGLDRRLAGLRVGVLRTLWEALSPGVAAALEQALQDLRGIGLSTVDVVVPSWDAAVDAGTRILECEAAREHGELALERGDELLAEVRERLQRGMRVSAVDYVEAAWVGARLRHELRHLLTRLDVLVLPGRQRTAPRIDPDGRSLDPRPGLRCPLPLNVAGLPALAVPCGFDRRGLPIGLQLAGNRGHDALVVAVGHAFQQATDWHARRPPLDAHIAA
jgi:aspartyl-tRNA(Asn)/glutamyl-tRNA(Gln) amidotransferase subunit A